MFLQRRLGNVEWLVVGLGNPGKRYEESRHNVGFEALDTVAKQWGIPVLRAKFDALTGVGEVDGFRVLLMKPQNYMNLSGESVQKAAAFYKLPAKKVIVLVDDVALPVGALRIRLSGSSGGHNGLKSIEEHLGDSFLRIRIGVGDRVHPEHNLADWVLGRFSDRELSEVRSRYTDVAAAARLLLQDKAQDAMNLYNGAREPVSK